MGQPDSLAGTPLRQARALALAAGLALLHTAWALFQWYELLVARRGGEVICGPGGGHCAEVWDSPFASAVHAHTGLPVAAWGVAWGVTALVLPLVARIRIARRRVVEPWLAGTLLTAAGGVVGAAGLLTASLLFGPLCTTCGATYLLVLAYAGVCAFGIGLAPLAQFARGAPIAGGVLALAFALLLVPGTHTPQSSAAAGARAVQSVPALAGGTPEDREIARFIASLPEAPKQLLSDTLAAYAKGPVVVPPPARSVIGPANARLALTEFTDTLCTHCAETHEILLELRKRFGPDVFSLAPHQYPLDKACNKAIVRDESEPIRCLAARVKICSEGKPGEFELAGELFKNQESLTEEKVWELAAPLGPKEALAACVSSPETDKKLQDDIAWALAHGIRGTPFLFVGGRQAIAFPPLLYVLALTRGEPTHPAFASLPPPQPLPWEK
ncbi:MAG: thioredoxin domain-containing protein [Myxococcota bacterium]